MLEVAKFGAVSGRNEAGCDDGTKSGSICFGFCGAEGSVFSELGKSASCVSTAEGIDKPLKGREAGCEHCGGLGTDLAKATLEKSSLSD